jgi:hypothetical protein
MMKEMAFVRAQKSDDFIDGIAGSRGFGYVWD